MGNKSFADSPAVKNFFKQYKKEHPFKSFLLDIWGGFVYISVWAIILGIIYWIVFIS
jgi:hypothetical protein